MSVDVLLRRATKHRPAETDAEHLILELGVALDEVSLEKSKVEKALLNARQNAIAYGEELRRYSDALRKIAFLEPDSDKSAQEIALDTLGFVQ